MVHRNESTKRWSFRTTIRTSDGRTHRIHGTPGAPGPYHDLAQTKAGAHAAERRAISHTMKCEPIASEIDGATLRKAVDAFAAAELKRGVSRNTISSTLWVLSRLINFVTDETTRLRLPISQIHTESRAEDRADVERLLAACEDDRYRAIILLASEAGLRAGEIRDLQWIDLEDTQLTVHVPMDDKPRIVPLSQRLDETLAALKRSGRWIVSKLDGDKLDHGSLMRALGEIYDRAGIVRPSGLLHCLRLTFKESSRG